MIPPPSIDPVAGDGRFVFVRDGSFLAQIPAVQAELNAVAGDSPNALASKMREQATAERKRLDLELQRYDAETRRLVVGAASAGIAARIAEYRRVDRFPLSEAWYEAAMRELDVVLKARQLRALETPTVVHVVATSPAQADR